MPSHQKFVERSALDHASKALLRLAKAGKRLEASKDLQETQDAWADFLHLTHKVYEKIKAGSRGNTKAWAWFGLIQDERRDDQLLCYVHHARNADHHRFEEITKPENAMTSFTLSGSYVFNDIVFTSNGEIIGDWKGDPIVVELLPERLLVLPVTDSGVEYPVPRMHKGKIITDPNVSVLAKMTFSYVREMVQVADALSR